MFIAVVIPIHFENETRKELTRISLQRLTRQSIPVSPILVGSTQEEKKFAQELGCFYSHQKNIPLSKKYQKGVYYARNLNPEIVMMLDSDTWISDNYCEVAIKNLQYQQIDGIGMSRFYVLNIDTWEVRQQNYERVYEPIGTGRVFLPRSLDLIDWRLFPDRTPAGDLAKRSHAQCLTVGLNVPVMNEQTCIDLLELRSSRWTSIYGWDALKNIPTIIPYHKQEIRDGKSWLKTRFPGGVNALECIP